MGIPQIFPLARLNIDPETGKPIQEVMFTNSNDQMVVVTDGKTLVGRSETDRGTSTGIKIQEPLFLSNGVLGSYGGTGGGEAGPPGPPGPAGPQGPAGPASTVPGPPGATGPQGPAGPTGAASTVPGPQGPQGPVGPQGVKGDTGAASTVPGPVGPTGPQGAKGDTGVQGPQGVKGDQGTQGVQGPKGDQGVEGPQGIQGPIGPQGATGSGITMQGSVPTEADLPATGNAQGDAYIVQADDSLWIWDSSAWVSGGSIQGPPGSQGPQGTVGPQGPAGPQGDQGIQGAQGVQGPIGATGADSTVPGPAGPAGPKGDTGATGATGADSTVPGPQGPKGDPGTTGATGPQGPAGATGATGATGPQGPQGVPGVNADPSLYVAKAGDTMTGGLGVVGQIANPPSASGVYSGTASNYGQIKIMGQTTTGSIIDFMEPGDGLVFKARIIYTASISTLGISAPNLSFSGPATFNNAVAMTGNLTVSGTSTQTGTASFANGISLGSVAVASGTDLSKHINLYGSNSYGFSVTGGTLNIVASNVLAATLTGTLSTFNGNMTVSGGNLTVIGSAVIQGALNLGSANGPTRALSLDGANIYMSFNTAGAEGFLIGKEGDNSTGRLLIYKAGVYTMTMSAAGHTVWSGNMTVSGNFNTNLISGSQLNTTGYVMLGNSDYGLLYFGNTGGRYLQYTGGQLNYVGLGTLNMGGNAITGVAGYNGGAITCTTINTQGNTITAGSINGTTLSGGTVYMPDANNYLVSDGSNIILRSTGGMFFQSVGGINDRPIYCGSFTTYGGGFAMAASGGGIASDGVIQTAAYGQCPGGGAWRDTSDERIKIVLGDYKHGLSEILALQPKRYLFKGNDTIKPPANSSDKALEQDASAPVLPYRNSNHYDAAVAQQEYVGLIAQEAEVPMPELVTYHEGYVDGDKVEDLRILDNSALVYALVNAVKSLAATNTALEARIAALEGA